MMTYLAYALMRSLVFNKATTTTLKTKSGQGRCVGSESSVVFSWLRYINISKKDMYAKTTESLEGSNEDLIPPRMAENAFGYAQLQLGGDEVNTGHAPYSVVFSKSPSKVTRRKLQKILLLAILFLIIICAVFIALYVSSEQKNVSQQKLKTNYCSTPGCVDAASFMQTAMDTSVNPCKDFYKFACGGWIKKNPIPAMKSHWGVDSILGKRNINTLKQILEREEISEKPATNDAKMKATKFYRACLNENERKKLGAKPLLNLLKKFDGSTSQAGKDKESQLRKYLEIYNKNFSISALFSTFVEVDARNSSRYAIQITQSGLTLSQTRYTGNMTDKVLKAYHKYLIDIHVLLGAKDTNETRVFMMDILQFETNLSKIFVPRENMTEIDQNYKRMTIAKLQTNCPMIDWLKFYQNVYGGIAKITADHEVIVLALPYMQKLSSLVKRTPSRVLFMYLHWKMISSFVGYLSDEFHNAQKDLEIALFGTSLQQERWKTCIQHTDNSIGFALGAMFVNESFPSTSKKQAREMVEELRSAFIKDLPNVQWMDDKTRNAAKSKAEAVVPKIGFPDDILHPKLLNKLYSGVEFSENNYFSNILNSLEFKVQRSLKLLPKVVDKNMWYMTPSTVNAYYDPTRNQIVFPAGILQPPYYDVRYPVAVNFGGIGAVIGHELLHGFDNDGRLYDKNGNSGKLWWSDYAVREFKRKEKCFIDEYGRFTIKNKHVNGKVTLGENIADNGGLAAAFRAYKAWVKKNGEDSILPGIARSNEQVFFISFAQSWCTSSRTAAALAQLDTDTHSPAQDRVLGSVSNSDEFSKAFSCPVGSVYNPSKKCKIW